ncbi:DUF924 family protein [Allopusillimonas ginsengisoli]|uniref:DUF924 family protein n=1 Tax=Allopusillimonas ginsengisoli TaxID=453575 RepID=UPI00101F8A2B|nr:DUF924 family protein [Allopusillimonas ginsengisoli]TEA79450.1 DUF924 family protein [Allopusillimonas ginsengisoli]
MAKHDIEDSRQALGLDQAQALVDFWKQAGPKAWFAKNDAFDAAFRDRFMTHHWLAARAGLDGWVDNPIGALALVLLLDQFPRNAFRGTPHMFATDGLARVHARAAIGAGHIQNIDSALVLFFCVPFIHSEELVDQRYGVELYRRYASDNLSFALDHCAIIDRFGRFPHRNPLMGRNSTPDEIRFLEEGGFAG